jgi:hypothetical protein
MRLVVRLLCAACLLGAPGPVAAQAGTGSARNTAGGTIAGLATAARTAKPPVIDGRPDEAEWQAAPVVGGFVQREPFEGQAATERTEVRILFDATSLFIAAWLFDTDAGAIVLGETRRDAELSNSDAFRILLDTYLDRQNGFIFGTTPAGIEFDGQVTREGQGGFTGQLRQAAGSGGGFNVNWDGSWDVATTRDERGWYIEFRIPFATLRYDRSGAQQWGLNFARVIRRRNEESVWSPIPRQFDFYRVSAAGLLDGLEAPARKPFSVTPYLLASGRRDYVLGSSTDYDFAAGGDAKIGLAQSLTLDLTVNTDFAQVEVDDQQINLTRFNLFFPEKRPFFLENAGTFSVGTPQEVEIFFSRRIGIASGQAVPILGGGRLTGRVAGFNIGLLDLQTERLERSDAATGDILTVAPANNYGVARVLRELGNRTRLGGTVVSRINTADGHDHNWTWAADGRLGLGQSFTVDAYVAGTDKVNASNGERAGAVSGTWTTRNWEAAATYREVGENFTPEVGFVPRLAYRFASARALRHVRTPGVRWFRELRPHFTYREYWDLDGFSETRLIHFDSHFEFANGAFFQLPALNITREGLKDPFEIAEGVVVPPGTYDNLEWGFAYNTNRSARVVLEGRVDIGGFYSGHRAGGDNTLTVRAGDTFVAALRANYYRVWLKQGDFETAVLGLRAAWSFTPRIYLQALLQYNDRTESFSSNLRFGWLGTAGTGLYLVYNDTESTGPFARTGIERGAVDRTLVLKFTRQLDLFR